MNAQQRARAEALAAQMTRALAPEGGGIYLDEWAPSELVEWCRSARDLLGELAEARPVEPAPAAAEPGPLVLPPAMVAGAEVLAFARLADVPGRKPHGVALAAWGCGPAAYAVWDVYTADGGQSWHAENGAYPGTPEGAWAAFTARVSVGELPGAPR